MQSALFVAGSGGGGDASGPGGKNATGFVPLAYAVGDGDSGDFEDSAGQCRHCITERSMSSLSYLARYGPPQYIASSTLL